MEYLNLTIKTEICACAFKHAVIKNDLPCPFREKQGYYYCQNYYYCVVHIDSFGEWYLKLLSVKILIWLRYSSNDD